MQVKQHPANVVVEEVDEACGVDNQNEYSLYCVDSLLSVVFPWIVCLQENQHWLHFKHEVEKHNNHKKPCYQVKHLAYNEGIVEIV